MCGRSASGNISPANPIWVKFSTDATVQNRGFLFRFSTSNHISVFFLPKFANLFFLFQVYGGDFSGESGQISTPHYPRQYGPDMDVHWTITVQEDYMVRLEFIDFDLENLDASSGCYDFIEIRDGATHESPLLGSRMCGRKAEPGTIYSSSNVIHIFFHSDSSLESYGFLANWTAVPWGPRSPGDVISSCTFTIEVNDTNVKVITPPPSSQSNSSYCIWKVKAPVGDHLIFNVSQLYLPSFSDRCRHTYVTFYERKFSFSSHLLFFLRTSF